MFANPVHPLLPVDPLLAIGPLLTVDPTVVALTAGVAQELTLGWHGLTPGKTYVGYVNFGASEWRTRVTITVPLGPPTISRVGSFAARASGSTAGGDELTIAGSGFEATTGVTLGGVPATVTAVSPTSISVLTPPHPVGVVDVVVVANGQSATAIGAFDYGDPPIIRATLPKWSVADTGGPLAIVGTGFGDNPVVTILAREVIRQVNLEGTVIDTAAPAGPLGLAKIVVTTDYGSAEFDLPYLDFPGEVPQ